MVGYQKWVAHKSWGKNWGGFKINRICANSKGKIDMEGLAPHNGRVRQAVEDLPRGLQRIDLLGKWDQRSRNTPEKVKAAGFVADNITFTS